MNGDNVTSSAKMEPDESGLNAADKKMSESQKSEKSGRIRAVAPLELVALPKQKRRLLLWLARQKEATFEEIVRGVALEEEDADLEETLQDLLTSGLIEEIEVKGENLYRCEVRGQSKRRVTGMRKDIWSRIDDQDSE